MATTTMDRTIKSNRAVDDVEVEVGDADPMEITIPIDFTPDDSGNFDELRLEILPLDALAAGGYYLSDWTQAAAAPYYITVTLHNLTAGQPAEVGTFRVFAEKV